MQNVETSGVIVGLDIGGHHVAGALVDESSWTLLPSSYRHVEVERGAEAEQLLTTWAALIDDVAASSTKPVRSVGVAMPGPFDYRSGHAYFEGTGKFESLYGIDVRSELSRRSRGAPELRFLNDATAFAVGCSGENRVLRHTHILALTLGTGLGSAFLDNGIPVIDGDQGAVPPEGCLWHVPFKDGIADDYISSRWLLSRARDVLGPHVASVAELAQTARTIRDGSEVFEEFGTNLAAIIAPWITSFACEGIVIGGRITGAFDLFSPSLESGLERAGALVPIAIHESTEDAAILGAAMAFDDSFWEIAKTRLPSR
jgi:glucokinase